MKVCLQMMIFSYLCFQIADGAIKYSKLNGITHSVNYSALNVLTNLMATC
jgi:hypothetical protein